jgi:hypothetical protein
MRRAAALMVVAALVAAAGACGGDSSAGGSAGISEVDVEDLDGLVIEVTTLDLMIQNVEPDLLVWSDGRVVVRDIGWEEGLVPARQARITAEGVDALQDRAEDIDPGAGYGVADVLDGSSTGVTLRTGDEAVSFSVDQLRPAPSDLPGLSSGQVLAREDLQEVLDDLVGILNDDSLLVEGWEPYVPDRMELLITPPNEGVVGEGEPEPVEWPLGAASGDEVRFGYQARGDTSRPCVVVTGDAAATVAEVIDELGYQPQMWTIDDHPAMPTTVVEVEVRLMTSTLRWCEVEGSPSDRSRE